MQDDKFYTGKKLTDRGWREMRKILDAEMPAPEKKRRRFGAWWLLPALLAGIATGGFALVKYFAQQPDQPEKTGIPVAVLPKVTEKAPAAGTPLAGTDAAPGLATGEAGTPNPAHAAPKRKSFSKEKQNAGPGVASVDEKNAAPFGFDQKTEAAPPSPTGVFIEKTETATLSLFAPAPAAPIEKLATLPIAPMVAEGENPPTVPAGPRSAKLGWLSFYGSGLVTSGTESGGLGAGMLATLPLKKSKWSLGGGVGYLFVRQPLSVVFTTNPDEQFSGATFNDVNAVVGDVESNRLEGLASNSARLLKGLDLHYLDIPVAASYRISPRISLKGGLNAALLLASDSEYASGGLFSNSFRFGSSESSEANILEDYSGETKPVELNNFDLSANAGIEYFLSARLAAGASYRFGLSDLIPDNGAGDFNRMLQVTLRYRWH